MNRSTLTRVLRRGALLLGTPALAWALTGCVAVQGAISQGHTITVVGSPLVHQDGTQALHPERTATGITVEYDEFKLLPASRAPFVGWRPDHVTRQLTPTRMSDGSYGARYTLPDRLCRVLPDGNYTRPATLTAKISWSDGTVDTQTRKIVGGVDCSA